MNFNKKNILTNKQNFINPRKFKTMKNLILTICLSAAVSFSFAQIDVVGPAGDVGVGIANPTEKLDIGGNLLVRGSTLNIGKGAGGNQVALQIGDGRTAQGKASFELIADKNSYPDFGFRFIRFTNGFTNIDHRGSSNLVFSNLDGASTFFGTSGSAKFSIHSNKVQAEVNAYKPGGGPWSSISDKRAKEDVNAYNKGLKEILSINPVSYKYNAEFIEANDQTYVGVIAQDLQKVVPSMVKDYDFTDIAAKKHTGYLSVDPNEFTYMLINSVKEQQEVIQNLQSQVNDLAKLVTDLQSNNSNTSLIVGETNKAQLAQNTPNPLKNTTKIEYFIPSESKSAAISVFDLSGKLIKSESISAKGLGSINLKVQDVSSGLYTYSLIIDGLTIDTKKMIIE